MAYWRLFYHCVWSTHQRLPLILPAFEADLYRFIQTKTNEYGCIFHAVGGVSNHIHVALSIPPHKTIAATVKALKGSSTYLIHHRHGYHEFAWQRGYGVCSFGERHMSIIKRYIARQKQHHAEHTLIDTLEVSVNDAEPCNN